MPQRVIAPSSLGFLLLDSHPAGCARTVGELAASVPAIPGGHGRRPVALVISGLGICLEKVPGRRTGTAGWYRTAATAAVAEAAGSSFTFLNADTFADETKAEAAAILSERYGWHRWVTALASRRLLARAFRTVALTYIGSELTAPVYRSGTTGAAKINLEATAGRITRDLKGTGGQAWTCVNSTAVTQASTHIPGVALYTSLLRGVLGPDLPSPAQQSVQLWDQLAGTVPFVTDDAGRIRLDQRELDPAVQAEVTRRWQAATPDTLGSLADVAWFRSQFRGLYGFDIPGIDYAAPVETSIPWPGGASGPGKRPRQSASGG
ncbi:MAG: hypothetical protein ACRDN0_32580 [Trebonia sp.]